mgnify:CR=1 FL=1
MVDAALERLADIEGLGQGGYIGGVPRMTRAPKTPPIMESQAIVNLRDVTDDKNAWKQWDLKFVNAFDYIHPGYGAALDKLKECVDRG